MRSPNYVPGVSGWRWRPATDPLGDLLDLTEEILERTAGTDLEQVGAALAGDLLDLADVLAAPDDRDDPGPDEPGEPR
jgi:hypothetical protein